MSKTNVVLQWSGVDVARFKAAYMNPAKSMREVGLAFGLSGGEVRYRAQLLGLPLRSDPSHPSWALAAEVRARRTAAIAAYSGGLIDAWTPDERATFAASYMDIGLTNAEVGEQFGLDADQVTYYAKRLALPPRAGRLAELSARRSSPLIKDDVSLETLANDIVRPGIDKHLLPLCLYRGNVGPGGIQRFWNFAITMMHCDVSDLTDAVKLSLNPEYSQLCGPHTKIERIRLQSFVGRMIDNPDVTNNIPGLTEYARGLNWRTFKLTKISLESYESDCAPWRTFIKRRVERKPREPHVAAKDLFYPYLIHEPAKPNELLALVNAAVPRYLPEQIRADLCQDIILAVLSGEITQEQVKDSIKSYSAKIRKMFPTRWGMVSLDESMFDDDGPSRHETLLPEIASRMEW